MYQSTKVDTSEDAQALRINEDDFEIFKDVWFTIDPDSTGYIATRQVDNLLTKLNGESSSLGFDIQSRSRPTMRRLAAVHARCHDFDVAMIDKNVNSTQIVPEQQAEQPPPIRRMSSVTQQDDEGYFRTVPFNEMLYILSAGLVPKDTLDAEGYVRLSMGESRVEKTLAVIKIQRWIKSFKKIRENAQREEDEKKRRESVSEGEGDSGVEREAQQQERGDRERERQEERTTAANHNYVVGPESSPTSSITSSEDSPKPSRPPPAVMKPLGFEHVRSKGDAIPPRSASMASSMASSMTSIASSTTSDDNDPDARIPLRIRRGVSETHPLTGLKISNGAENENDY